MLFADIWRLIQRSLDFSNAEFSERKEASEEARSALEWLIKEQTNARDLVHTFHIIDFLKRQMNALEPTLEATHA